eukprot:4768682-Prymnesium_polylepis.1
MEDFELEKVPSALSKHGPVPPPVWLGEVLKFGSDERNKIKGCTIAYRFSDEDGGWALGTIEAALDDEHDTTEVE